jgi:hypothetical protein
MGNRPASQHVNQAGKSSSPQEPARRAPPGGAALAFSVLILYKEKAPPRPLFFAQPPKSGATRKSGPPAPLFCPTSKLFWLFSNIFVDFDVIYYWGKLSVDFRQWYMASKSFIFDRYFVDFDVIYHWGKFSVGFRQWYMTYKIIHFQTISKVYTHI